MDIKMGTPVTLFEDIIYIFDLNRLDYSKLIKECTTYFDNFDSVSLSNVGGQQSEGMFLNTKLIENTEILNALNQIQKLLDNTCSERSFLPLEITAFWININREFNFNSRHSHPGSILSGVFYINNPKDSNSYIKFYRQRSFEDYMTGISNVFTPETSSTGIVNTKQGMLVLFPSHLEHETDINSSKEDRISIAFNTQFKHI